MNEHEQKKPIKERILAGIHAGDVVMRPRFHFTLKIAALVAVAFGVLIVSIFIFNFILFSIRINSHDTLLEFGFDGLLAFLLFFPWFLLALDIALIALLEWMIRRFRIGYTIPVLYLLALVAVVTIGTGLALDRGTDFNDRMLEKSHRLPKPFGAFYEGARYHPKPGSGICKCEILSIEGNTLVVEDLRSGTTTLVVTLPWSDMRATTTGLQIGDIVLIAGSEKGGVIEAYGVRKVVGRDSHFRK